MAMNRMTGISEVKTGEFKGNGSKERMTHTLKLTRKA